MNEINSGSSGIGTAPAHEYSQHHGHRRKCIGPCYQPSKVSKMIGERETGCPDGSVADTITYELMQMLALVSVVAQGPLDVELLLWYPHCPFSCGFGDQSRGNVAFPKKKKEDQL